MISDSIGLNLVELVQVVVFWSRLHHKLCVFGIGRSYACLMSPRGI